MKRLVTSGLAGLAIVSAGPALAHSGGTFTPLSGLLHPFLGIDHLLAMIGIGLLAAQRPARAALLLPAGFVAAVAVGLFAGRSGVTLSLAEPGIVASLIVFGTLVVAGARVAWPVTVGIGAFFGLAHGFAHGVEAVGAPLVYCLAFLCGSALLHAAGYLSGRHLETLRYGRLTSGLVLGASGLAFAIG